MGRGQQPIRELDKTAFEVGEGIHTDSPGSYEAAVENEECTGCEACVERCQFEAISMEEMLVYMWIWIGSAWAGLFLQYVMFMDFVKKTRKRLNKLEKKK